VLIALTRDATPHFATIAGFLSQSREQTPALFAQVLCICAIGKGSSGARLLAGARDFTRKQFLLLGYVFCSLSRREPGQSSPAGPFVPEPHHGQKSGNGATILRPSTFAPRMKSAIVFITSGELSNTLCPPLATVTSCRLEKPATASTWLSA
jgi:hypothetical protein